MEVPIKMFISQSEINEVLTKDNQTTAYIILQNNVLIQKHLDLIKENHELINQTEELTSYTDRLEKSKICLQGYVRNEHDLVLKYKKLYKIQNTTQSEIYTECIIMHAVPITLFIITPFIAYFFHVYMLMIVYITSIVAYTIIIGCSYKYINDLKKSNIITFIIEDIKKTTQSNVYLDDLIDNI